MSWWKQAIACIVLVCVGAVLWYQFFPGAKQIAAQWGIGTAPVVAQDAGPANGPAGRRPGSRMGAAPAGIILTEPVVMATVNDRLSAIGTGSALHTVAVRPYASGRLTGISVTSGSEVKAGDVIGTLDSESEKITVDRAQLTLEDMQGKLERAQALRSSNTVTAVQVRDAELALRNAELQLRDAQLALARRQILAPISGIVGILPVSSGDYVTSSIDVASIDDRSAILVDFWIPERYAPQVRVGSALSASSVARPNEAYDGIVSAIDNQVDAASRTLRVQAQISNPSDLLRSGMAFRVTMAFPGEQYPAVNPLALQWSNDGPFVWVVREGIAHKLDARVIQRNSENILIDGEFAAGDLVVTEGIHLVREGQPVTTNANTIADKRATQRG